MGGYPVEVASTGIDGYCTDSSLTSKADCTSTTEAGCASANNGCSTANKYCSVAGKCFWGSDPTGAVASLYAARTEDECGICSLASRYTRAECEKDVDNDGTADGTWTAHTNKLAANNLVWSQTDPSAATVTPIALVATTAVTAGAAGAGNFGFGATNDLITGLAVGDVILIATNSNGACSAAGSYTVTAVDSASPWEVDVAETVPSGVTAANCDMSRPANGCTETTGYTVGGGQVASAGVIKSHTWTPRPLGDAALTAVWATGHNEQCCSCVPAYGTTVSAATLSVFKSKGTCETGANGGDREGAVAMRRRGAVLRQGRSARCAARHPPLPVSSDA